MPNWCVNQLKITGDETKILELIELVKSSKSAFDFSKIVPIPNSKFYEFDEGGQNHFQCGCVPVYVELPDLPEVVAYTDKDGKDVMQKQGEWQVDGLVVKRKQETAHTIQGSVEQMFGGIEVCPIHNVEKNSMHPDFWYNWNVKHWGTKWNCTEVEHDRTDNSDLSYKAKIEVGKTWYKFDTAWSPAESLVAALAEKFPTLTFSHSYCEAGEGYAGEVVYRNGLEKSRQEYWNDVLPDEAYILDEEGFNTYDRNYNTFPMTPFEAFCDEYFGGIVGG